MLASRSTPALVSDEPSWHASQRGCTRPRCASSLIAPMPKSTALRTSRGLNRFHGQKNGLCGDVCCLTYFGLAPLVTATTADEEGCSVSRRCSSRLTLVGSHLPSHAAGICRSFNSRAMALSETKPALRSFRIVEAKALARTSAACLCDSPLLILPFVIRPRRASTLVTVVRCQLPPRAVAIPLRFSSSASARWDANPAAISFRIVEAKAWAWASAACLLANAP
jgi:hypothetical protein